MTFPLREDALVHRPGDLAVRSPFSEHWAEVGLFEREEAVAELAVGGQSEPVAAHAEGTTDRGDHADPTAAVGVLVIERRGLGVLIRAGDERADLRADLVDDLLGAEDLISL